MNKKETEVHETIDMSLTNLLNKIDLSVYHIAQSNEDYDHHIYDLQEFKRRVKRILNTDFDKLARNRK